MLARGPAEAVFAAGEGRLFATSPKIKDLMAYLRVVQNPDDAVSLGRIINVPPRKIGAKSRAALIDWAAANGVPIYEAFGRLAGAGPGRGEACIRGHAGYNGA